MTLVSKTLTAIVVLIASPSWSLSKPNILFLLIDDLGWNDVSFHGGSDFPTPHLDSLALDALELTNYYVQHICSPTRSALMSGRYPIHNGLQQYVIKTAAPYGLPLELTTLADHLKTAGYHTHIIGVEYTPLHRGFDSHLGYYDGETDYYGKNRSYDGDHGIDFRDMAEPKLDPTYSTYIYGNETMRLMKEHVADDDDSPFFIYLASQAMHTPHHADQYLIDSFEATINDTERRKVAAVMTSLDYTVGFVVEYLKSEESGYLWDDTLFIVSSDNGGDVLYSSSNFPLRGGKASLWEGGVKGVGFVTGGWIGDDRRGKSMNALMHVTDWYPTLTTIAGIDLDSIPTTQTIDGVDQSDNILFGETDIYSPRDQIAHNVLAADCDLEVCGAVRYRNYKLVVGNEVNYTGSDICVSTWCALLDVSTERVSTVECTENGNYDYPTVNTETDCPYNGEPCLYDLSVDPCEYYDIKDSEPEMYELLYQLLIAYNQSAVTPTLYQVTLRWKIALYPDQLNKSNPDNFGGFWSPWIFDEDSPMESEQFDGGKVISETEQMERIHGQHLSLSLMAVCGIMLMLLSMGKQIWKRQQSRCEYKSIEHTQDIIVTSNAA